MLRLRQLFNQAADKFWLLPGLLVVGGILTAIGLVELDRSGMVPGWLINSPWLYNGGGTGARTLLGAVVSSTIGVAGTVFSITIASLSLAAGQMGPRLLRNFMRDRGNQFTLGAFLGTFSYALMVLRSVRTEAEGTFVPHVALSVSILLSFLCVGTLVFFVGHMASRINVDTVIEQVSRDLRAALRRLTRNAPPATSSRPIPADLPLAIRDSRRGYLQQVDGDRLADWMRDHEGVMRLLVRPGDYVFPGSIVAYASASPGNSAKVLRQHMVLSADRVSDVDLEYAVRQLVEVAVRALSPGINDPHTAISVIDQLGAALCDLVSRHLPDGNFIRKDHVVLQMSCVTYDGLTDAMFHMIRQNAAGSPAVLIRLIEVLDAVALGEADPHRRSTLRRHANLVLTDAERDIKTPADLEDLRTRHERFGAGIWHQP